MGHIYEWAGEYRSVNISKGSFHFAAANRVPALMVEFERGPLAEFTPCQVTDLKEQAAALAVTHAELVLIHPFREGNGRCARLLSLLMAFQAGLPPLDFSEMVGAKKPAYFAAVHAAVSRDYAPMTEIFTGVLRRSLRRYAKRL